VGVGLYAGMTLSDAKAQVPELRTLEADPAADLALLDRLAEACRRYTPALAVDAPDGLYLNVSGTERLFGGEIGLIAEVTARFQRLGLSLRYGLADTPGLAWGLARFGERPVAGPGERAEILADLPMAALRLEADTVAVLRGLGLRRVGQLMDKARGPLARRIGRAALDRLDEALGGRACALALKLEVPPYLAEARLAEPITSEDQVLRVAEDLAAGLCGRLEGEGKGGRLFVLELFRVDGALKRLEVGTSRPLRSPPAIAALFTERLASLNEGLEADFGFEQARLWAPTVQPLKAGEDHLLGAPNAEGAFSALADRLTARLGVGAVRRLTPVPETRTPERAVRAEPFEAARPRWTDEPAAVDEGAPLRPITLFATPQPIETLAGVPEDPPHQFTWRRLKRRIVAAEGPERLEPEWGRSPSVGRMRDYYRLEDERGRRYWVFREGRFGDEAPVRWFLHGLFG
jgi:protein ImuB